MYCSFSRRGLLRCSSRRRHAAVLQSPARAARPHELLCLGCAGAVAAMNIDCRASCAEREATASPAWHSEDEAPSTPVKPHAEAPCKALALALPPAAPSERPRTRRGRRQSRSALWCAALGPGTGGERGLLCVQACSRSQLCMHARPCGPIAWCLHVQGTASEALDGACAAVQEPVTGRAAIDCISGHEWCMPCGCDNQSSAQAR